MSLFNKFHQAKHFLIHLLVSVDAHSIQPPFAFKFYTQAIKNHNPNHNAELLQGVRKELYENQDTIGIIDLGAGSQHDHSKERTISSIARKGISTKKKSTLLQRIVNHHKPQVIIELGTSLGLNTLYLSGDGSYNALYTIEGSPELAEFAKELFSKYSPKKINTIVGDINAQLPLLLNEIEVVDFVYMDANHTYESTLNYFKQINRHANEDTVIILDDIYWSPGMTKAWKEIYNSDNVSLSFDLFDFGIVFFKKGLQKQHYTVNY